MSIQAFILGFLLVSTRVFAQPKENACPCSLLLRETVQKVSRIYAGFDDKVTSQTKPAYNQLVDQLQKQAVNATSERNCYEIIQQYTDWFKDGHVGVWYGLPASPYTLRKVSLSQVHERLKVKKDQLEGIWSTADQTQQYAIIKDPHQINQYLAVTLKSTDANWQPGMVKMEFYDYDRRTKLYRGMYYQTDFRGVLNGFTLNHDRLDHWFGPSWYQTRAGAQPKRAVQNLATVQFKALNKDFVYLKLGKFNQEDVTKLDGLIRTHKALIYRTPNLIVDLRGNPGGDAGSSQEMIQLIYTNALVYPAWQYRSSPELISC